MSKRKKNTDATIALNRRILGANARYREAVKIINELELELAHRESIKQVSKIVLPKNYKVVKSADSEATIVLNSSDWHIDEIVEPAAVNYLNEFNLQIAEKRVDVFFTHALRIINLLKHESTIDTLVLWLGGDFISGWIHPSLIESSLMSPPEALLKVFELLLGGIRFLTDKGNFKQIITVCSVGNHGRITVKKRDKGLAKKSYEYLLYEFLARKLAGTKYAETVKFILPQGYFTYLNIYDYTLRFHHGDNVQYRGGIGGIHIPLKKAIAQWNKAKHADIDVMGHWHTREISEDYVINGSLIGYNEFAIQIKADFRPPMQSLFLMHPKYGKTAEYKIIVE